MARSALTGRISLTDQYDEGRGGASIEGMEVHHAATTSDSALISAVMGAREVSSNYGILRDGTLVQFVDERNRAWTSGSGYDDRRLVTVEVVNEGGEPDWRWSDAAFDMAARLIADVATRYGFPIDRDHVIPHRDLNARWGRSYSTRCPGEWLLARYDALLELARKYQAGKPANGSGSAATNTEDEDMNYINIQGKAGARRGGCYAVFNLGGGKFVAEYIGGIDRAAGPLVSDDAAIARLQKRISGLA